MSHFNSAVIFGPNMQNFKEIKEKILTTKSGIQVKNSRELADKIAYFLKNETKRTENHPKNEKRQHRAFQRAMNLLEQ